MLRDANEECKKGVEIELWRRITRIKHTKIML